MKQGKSRSFLFQAPMLILEFRLDYLTNVLGFDSAASQKLILQREKGQ
jgi:hypothetical protein